MRIFVTNDDGIDSIGLHILARSMLPFGEVVIGAPDTEYSGASSSFGALHLIKPELHKAFVEGIDEAWAITGPPALCVMFARLGAFGDPFDLVVSGINPGANVGRSVYHSGTIGACLTARNGGITGVAVSQAVDEGGYMGQGIEEMLRNQKWDSAAEIAALASERPTCLAAHTNITRQCSERPNGDNVFPVPVGAIYWISFGFGSLQ